MYLNFHHHLKLKKINELKKSLIIYDNFFLFFPIFLHFTFLKLHKLFSYKIGEDPIYKFICKNGLSSVEENIEQEDELKDQGRNGRIENGILKKKNGKIAGKRGRKANINHKENSSKSTTIVKLNGHLENDEQQTVNSCANNTRSKCRKSRSGRSIRNNTRLSPINYNDNVDDDDEISGDENSSSLENRMDNNADKFMKPVIMKTRRTKNIKLDNNNVQLNQRDQQLINNQLILNKDKIMENQNSIYLNDNKKIDDNKINVDNLILNDQQLQYTELNGQRQINNAQQSTIDKQLQNNCDKLNNNNNNKSNNCINNHLYDNSPLTCNTINDCSINQLQSQHNNDYIIENENNLNFMQQMHGYSLTNNGQQSNNSNKDTFMQTLNEHTQITNNTIMSTENRSIDDQMTIKNIQNDYEEDLDEIQRASLILDDNSIEHHKNNIIYLNNQDLNNNNNNSIYVQHCPNGLNDMNNLNAMNNLNDMNNNLNSNQASIHQQQQNHQLNENNNLNVSSNSTVNTATTTYTLCCSIPAQSNIAYNQCLDNSTLGNSIVSINSASFTQSNPLLASRSTDSSITSLTSMSPVQLECSPSIINTETPLHTSNLNDNTTSSNNLNSQSNLLHYSTVQHNNIQTHLNESTSNYSSNLNEHQLVQNNPLINQTTNHHHLQSQITSNCNITTNQQQLNLNTDHIYHNTLALDSNSMNCSATDCTDLLESYQLEPINNLLNLGKKNLFSDFEEQLIKEKNENNLNNANPNFSLDAEKDVIYLLSSNINSNNQNVSFIL